MLTKICTAISLMIASVALTSCSSSKPQTNVQNTQIMPDTPLVQKKINQVPVVYQKLSPKKTPTRRINKSPYANSFNNKLSNAALGRLRSKVRYDGSYVKIAYPGGDVPQHIGVCTDVVIRSYRKLGIDLQEQVHRDMSAAFNTYPNPKKWGLSRPDTNIDHRRVYNLRKFFQRRGAGLPITRNPHNYKPGDIVSWMVGPDLPHIGVVVNKRSKVDPNRFMVVHNIARGPQLEDMLFAFPITGHYRYTPAHMGNIPNVMYAKNKTQYNRGFSNAQLAQAASILGTSNYASSPKRQTNNQQLDQVVRLNSIAGPVVKATNSSLTLANLSTAEIESLLSNKN